MGGCPGVDGRQWGGNGIQPEHLDRGRRKRSVGQDRGTGCQLYRDKYELGLLDPSREAFIVQSYKPVIVTEKDGGI